MPTTETQQDILWNELCTYVREWFAEPDLDALRIALTVGRAHMYSHLEPVWLLIVGPSGCGKTTLFIRCLQGFPNAHLMGDLTPQTFLSGKRKGSSFLTKCGPSAFLLFKDFTTFLSKRQEDRIAIASQLRELHDGEWTKETGEIGHQSWSGKMTVVAACTPVIERYWAAMRELGERFVTVRVRVPPLELIFQKMREDRNGATITRHLRQMSQALAGNHSSQSLPDIPPRYWPQMDALAMMIAQCRQNVHRASNSKREIIEVTQMEAPTRITSALMTTVRLSADIAGREVNPYDLKLAIRLACDSIPSVEWQIIQATPADTAIDIDDAASLTGLTPKIIQYHTDKLQALHILRHDRGEEYLELTPEFATLKAQALQNPASK